MLLDLEPSRWRVINDGVMGGLSRSEVLACEQGLLFRGNLSLENNGGFASMRCRFAGNFTGTAGFHLTLKGDGRKYQFRLRADESSDGIAWRAEFDTDGTLQSVEIGLCEFVPVIRGRKVGTAGALEAANIHLLGFMLADRQAGHFRLEVHGIEALSAPETVRLD